MHFSLLTPDLANYNVATSVGEYGERWKESSPLMPWTLHSSLAPDVASCSTAISVCEKGKFLEVGLSSVAGHASKCAHAERGIMECNRIVMREGQPMGTKPSDVAADVSLVADARRAKP